MRTALILSTAFITTLPASQNREQRLSQYLQGIAQASEIVKIYPNLDVFFVDNTVEDKNALDQRIIQAIAEMPNVKSQCFFFQNDEGKKNKGAGNVVQWKKVLQEIPEQDYKYLIHFEPRQKLLDFSFFDLFFSKPANYFKIMRYRVTGLTHNSAIRLILEAVPIFRSSYLTGLFSLEVREMKRVMSAIDPVNLVKRQTSLEDEIFIKLKNVPIIPVSNLGILWRDPLGNDVIF